MQVNIYSQELTSEALLISEKAAETGLWYYAVRLMLHSSTRLHQTPDDDDRSAVTIWLPYTSTRRAALVKTLRELADLAEDAPYEDWPLEE